MSVIRLSTLNDLPLIHQLADEIWHEYYLGIISVEQIDYMLNKFYSPPVLEKLMKEGQMFYLIIGVSGEVIGYLAVTEKQKSEWFMNKFYIKTKLQGHGIGKEVLKKWEALAGPKELSLQVNRKNYKSINFYFKTGFKIIKVADFDIGDGYTMDDFVMLKKYL